MSSSGGKIEYVVSVNDAGVSGKIKGVETSITGVGTAAQQTAAKTQSLGTGLGNVATKGQQAGNIAKGLKSSFAGTAAGMAGLGLGIAGIGSQIANLSDQYDNLKDTELQLNKARTLTEKKVNAVTALELRLAKMRKDGKSSAADIKLVEDKLRVARDASKNAVNDLANREDDYQRAQRAFYLQVGPQILGIMAQMGSSIMIMKTASAGAGVGMEGMSKGAKLLSVALKAIPLVAIAGAILAIRNNTFGFRDALESVGVKIGQILPGLKPFLDWVHNMAAALGLTGGGVDFGKAFELLKTGFTSAIDTIMHADWSKILGDMMDKISNWFNNADWKVLWKMFQDAVIASVDWINKNFGKVWEGIVNWFKAQKWDVIWQNFYNAVISSVDWINTNFKKIYTAIETWIKAQDWAAIWQAFQDAFMSSVVWVGEKLGAVYTAVDIWAKKQDWAAIWKTIQDMLFPTVTIAAGTFDTWGANVIKELGAALTKSIKTLGGLLKGDSKFIGGLQQAFTDAGSAVDWVGVGNGMIYNFFLSVGKWEFKTFHKSIAASFQTTFELMAALIDFKTTATKFVQGIGNAIGTALSGGVQVLLDAAKAIIDSLGKAFTPANFAAGATKFVNALVAAIKSVPANLLTGAGTWLWQQISAGLGAAGKAFTDALQGILPKPAAAGGPTGGTAVQSVTPSVNADIAKGTMTSILDWWKRIAGDIQGIIPALKVDSKPATATMDAVMAVWRTKATTISAILAQLKADSKPATATMDAVAKVWQTKAQTISANVPKLTANNTSAIQIMDAVVKRWQSAAKTISGIQPKITVNNSQAISAINKVVSAMNSVKSKTVTLTTVIRTVKQTVGGHNITGRVGAHNITGAGAGAGGDIMTTPLIGGGNMTNTIGTTAAGDVNVIINMRDEFGIEKQRKFKAVLGRDRYVFGSVGAGG